MKKLSTTITEKNGTVRVITVELENELADWLITQPKEVYRDFILFEYRARCVERKETRYVQSLDNFSEGGYGIKDTTEEHWDTLFMKIDLEQALSRLSKEQQWLIRQIYFLGRSRVEVACILGVTEGAIRSRLHTIFQKLEKILK